MPKYKICDEATQDNAEFDTAGPDEAMDLYLVGYGTVDVDGANETEGSKYSELNAWDGDDCVATRAVIADGGGGVQ